ncbi:MAG TPA: hypothetical protein VLF59_05120 [Candidatus Saccharimonadales bacterium]|nr:hypothetical protein [Candidatus Saccharimonadales bacterium]
MFLVKYPDAVDAQKVGTYPAETYSGGGYFYDEVLEYRVWKKENGKSLYYAFAKYKDAAKFAKQNGGAEAPVVLVRQNSYVDDSGGKFKQIPGPRDTRYRVECGMAKG